MQRFPLDLTGTSRRRRLPLLLMTGGCLLLAAPEACLASGMNGPGRGTERRSAPSPGPETSIARILFLQAVDLYRKHVSPIDGPRCGFAPSCSSFARQAVSQEGVVRGVMMTADRLTRCNIFKEPGPDYHLLPDGRLLDPVSANTLNDQ
jgi:putative membrane protein insertion efficiency factor